ncbi:hypothetical protein T4B_14821 [Trichinella pseudospiralis]|uniref:Uncharacterized protein n=1 Tax=Trichinella pseudospiralis TaxID=6337 RepID=A0A0V1EHU5_TRIPS|nr:hypothetical protein T4A_681 [Trichinella pseudospiralis]KRZ21158.1 hypothetical protein T4B_14821 [Trichinella pseudospiralis]
MSYAPTGILNKNMVQDKIKFPLHCSARRKPPIPANNSRIRGIFCEINDTKVQIPNCFFTLLNYCKRSTNKGQQQMPYTLPHAILKFGSAASLRENCSYQPCTTFTGTYGPSALFTISTLLAENDKA